MDIHSVIDTFAKRNPNARVTLGEDEQGLVVGVAGSLELKLSYELQNLLTLVVEQAEPGRRLAIDLSEVSYISSTGVGAMINALVGARKRNVDIVFLRVPRNVMSVIEVLGLTSFFPMEGADG